jgi:arginyl-tRNA synthetase
VTPADLAAAIYDVFVAACEAGELEVAPQDRPAHVQVERPRQKEHGDYATNLALTVAKQAGRSPREVAEILAARLREVPDIEAVDVAGPGFLNLTVSSQAQGKLARRILR